MSEIEVPIESVQEEMQHHAVHSNESLLTIGALLSAFLAVLAAVAALNAGHHANEAMIEQIQASDHWGHYQAKAIKASILDAKRDILASLGKPMSEESQDKREKYKSDQEEIQKEATEAQESSLKHLAIHQMLAKAVTFCQVAIGITAIAVLVRRKSFLYVSSTFGVVGLFYLIKGLFFLP